MNKIEKFDVQWKTYNYDVEVEDESTEETSENGSQGYTDVLSTKEETISYEMLGSVFYASKTYNPQYARLKNTQQRILNEGINTATKKLLRYKEKITVLKILLDPERLQCSVRIASHINVDIKNIELFYYILALYEVNYFLDTNNTIDRQTFIILEGEIDHSHFNQRYLHILSHVVRDLFINNATMFDFSNPEVKLLSIKLKEYLANYKEIFTKKFELKHTSENLVNKYFEVQSGLFFCKLIMIATITNELQKVSYKLYRGELHAKRLTPWLINKLSDLIREKLLINKNVIVKSPLYFVLALLKHFDKQLFSDYTSILSIKPQTYNVTNLERHKTLFEEFENKMNW